MIKGLATVFLSVFSINTLAQHIEVILKDNASVQGELLTTKDDQIFLDIGYTVLPIPREKIVTIKTIRSDLDESSRSANHNPGTAGSNGEESGDASIGGNGIFFNSSGYTEEKPVREWIEELGESVVQVKTPRGFGSGFIINKRGYLMTNYHVIEGESRISIEVFHRKKDRLDRKTYQQIRIIALNKFADLALLKIEDPLPDNIIPVKLGDNEELEVGEPVFAIGNPLGLERTVTEGIISTKTRPISGTLFLQTTAQINPGNSGGPLFNLKGEVIGITNMKMNYFEGLAFAIPVSSVKHFLIHRDAFAYDNKNPSSPFIYLAPPGNQKH
ncbi:MAG: trypsin-like peptidase domain-containing protein [Nitrospinaceae bacterium]|nr:trypsin-like peptidase domain-containing protein [Nitrospinaceae bacterium]